MNKILILVPHADDELLGFGGSIIKHVNNGDEVHVGILKESYDFRSSTQNSNINETIKHLGYKKNHFLQIKEKDLENFNIKTLKTIEEFIEKVNPNTLYIPHYNDAHQDHVSTFNFARIATRIYGKTSINTILCGEIISSSGNGFYYNEGFCPNYYNILSEEIINKKINTLNFYLDEIKPFPHPRSAEGIRITAQKRGMECNSLYAEAFVCVRNIML